MLLREDNLLVRVRDTVVIIEEVQDDVISLDWRRVIVCDILREVGLFRWPRVVCTQFKVSRVSKLKPGLHDTGVASTDFGLSASGAVRPLARCTSTIRRAHCREICCSQCQLRSRCAQPIVQA